jgi:hypothetical protein
MTQEEKKNLLLRDLCARLPYEVKCRFEDTIRTIDGESSPCYDSVLSAYHLEIFIRLNDFYIKPYLRPLSSMTMEEFEYLAKLRVENSLKCIEIDDPKESFSLATKFCVEQLCYLYENHYDVNGLIPSGLAIEVTEDNNPYKD